MAIERDRAIDLLRCVLMSFICLIHAVGYVDARCNHCLAIISRFAVVGFVLISGYLGVRFSVLKVIKLEGTGVFCAMVISVFIGGEVVEIFRSYWFLHAYVLMMFLAPLVNKCLEVNVALTNYAKKKIVLHAVLPCVLLVYLWGFMSGAPLIWRVIPRTEGLVPFSGLTLLAIYVVGRCYRIFNLQALLSWYKIIFIMMFCVIGVLTSKLSWAGGFLAWYNSPFVLSFAICVFWMFRKINVYPFVGRIVAWITPSVFSIYLFHCNKGWYLVFDKLETMFLSWGMSEYYVFVLNALIAFFAGIVMDVPRRILIVVFKRPLKWLCQMIEKVDESVFYGH